MQNLGHRRTVVRSAFLSFPSAVREETNLEDHDVDEHEENTSSIASLVISADVLPLKEGFGQKNNGKQEKAPHYHLSVVAFSRRSTAPPFQRRDLGLYLPIKVRRPTLSTRIILISTAIVPSVV